VFVGIVAELFCLSFELYYYIIKMIRKTDLNYFEIGI